MTKLLNHPVPWIIISLVVVVREERSQSSSDVTDLDSLTDRSSIFKLLSSSGIVFSVPRILGFYQCFKRSKYVSSV